MSGANACKDHRLVSNDRKIYIITITRNTPAQFIAYFGMFILSSTMFRVVNKRSAWENTSIENKNLVHGNI